MPETRPCSLITLADSGVPPPPPPPPIAALLQALAPKLDREEELYVISLTDLAARTLGDDSAKILSGMTDRAVSALLGDE